MPLHNAVETAMTLLQQKPQADDGELRDALIATGITPDLAARLVYFIPIALCRMVFGAVGVQFALNYVVVDPEGNETGNISFLADPVYTEVTAYCSQVMASGQQAEQYRSIAARSPDYRTIMDLHLKQGVALNALALPPPHLSLPLPENGQGTGTAPAGAPSTSEAQGYLDTIQAHRTHPFVQRCFYEVTNLECQTPDQGSVSFWTIQFLDQQRGAMIWQSGSGDWSVGAWLPTQGKEQPLSVDLAYFRNGRSGRSFEEAVALLETDLAQSVEERRPWYTRLWKRSE